VTCQDFIELQRHWLHDKDSHDDDGSKKLKHSQIVSVVEAAKTAPALSSAVLHRNLMVHDSLTKTILPQLQRCVQRSLPRMCSSKSPSKIWTFSI
jgi:hypothetical protein